MAEVAQCRIGPDPALATQGYASEHESDSSVLCSKEEQVSDQVTKHRKKSRRHRDEKSKKRKRSTSCSTVSSSCSVSVKKHKKKKKHRRDDPPSPRVNPIFLWIKQTDTKIVKVMCEDYDKRNRIRLTKTPAGWRAIPRSEFLTRQSTCPLVKEDTKEDDEEEDEEETADEEAPKEEIKPEPSEEVLTLELKVEEPPKTEGSQQCEAPKCCDMDIDLNVDENHNNDYENVAEPEPEPITKQEFEEKGLKDLIDELDEELHEEVTKTEAQEKPDLVEVDELEEMCNQRIQEEVCEKKEDVYEFIPSPKPCEEKIEEPEFEEEANSPMNLVMEHKSPEKPSQKLHESLDIVWRLPEGTTIQQAPARPVDTKPAQRPSSAGKYHDYITPRPSSAFQEEPLDLGKPRPSKRAEPKIEPAKPRAKDDLSIDDKTKSKLLELLTSQDPLTQLKEVLSDPSLIVPDPLLVPRARLPALVANPKTEIPRLLSQKQEKFSYPKLEPDLLVVSLDHLHSLLQKNGKEEEMAKIYQHHQEMLKSMKKQDMDANALNQMLLLPYLSQLAACESNPELLTMLNMVIPPYHYNPYHFQQLPTPPYDINQALHHGHYAWPEMAKPHPSGYLRPQVRPTDSRSTSRKREATPYYMSRDSFPQTKIRASAPEPCPNRFPQSEVNIFLKPSTDYLKTTSSTTKKSHHSAPSSNKKEEKLPEVPRIRVRDHLIDPNAKQKLLNYEMGNLPTTPLPEESQPHLWHPLFSSGEAKPYTSPWQWTTPVTVGE